MALLDVEQPGYGAVAAAQHTERRRRRHRSAGLLVAVAAAVFAGHRAVGRVATAAAPTARGPITLRAERAVADADGAVRVDIDLLDQPEVRAYLKLNGVDTDDDTDDWVPTRVALTLHEARARGGVGAHALEGGVLFNVVFWDGGAYTSSLLLFVNLTGTVLRVKPLGADSAGNRIHVNGLKMHTPSTALCAGNANASGEEGPALMYHWEPNTLEILGRDEWGGSHDIQWQGGGNGSYWRAGTKSLVRYDARTGATLERLPLSSAFTDINHFQMLENQTEQFVINGRVTNNFAMVSHTDSSSTVWQCGGDGGDFEIADLTTGVVYAPGGGQPWAGQHNLEYYGNGDFYLFDNNFNATSGEYLGDASLLKVHVDEGTRKAQVTWRYGLGHESAIFGDADRLPTGNVLATEWPRVYPSDVAAQYDARVFEVTPESDVAFEVKVVGKACEDDACADRSTDGQAPSGWAMYSAERVYFKPLVYDVSCSPSSGARPARLAFTTNAAIKLSRTTSGSFAVRAASSAGDIAQGAVVWRPHWLPTTVNVTLALESAREVTLTVTDEWDLTREVTASCYE